LVKVNFKYIVGFEERRLNETTTELIGFFNNQPFHSPPLAFNVLTNAVLKTFTNSTVKLTNHPLPYSNLDALKQSGSLYTVGFQVGYNIGFGMSFLAASFVVFLITERETKSKHLQFVSGLKFPIFWLANYIVDFVFCLIPCFFLLGILILFKIEDFYHLDMQVYLMILFGNYSACVIPFMYLWSYCFTIPASGFVRMAMFNIFTGI
jgi:ATP-binding cassette subfamily A (ABC1) protein 3